MKYLKLVLVALLAAPPTLALYVPLWLLVINPLLFDAIYGRGPYPVADYREVEIDGVTIGLERRQIHPFLAEYDRRLLMALPGGESIAHDLFKDTGGASRLNFCRERDGVIRLSDRFHNYLLSLETGGLMRLPSRKGGDDACGSAYIGAIGEDASGRYRFVPVSEQTQCVISYARRTGL
jgi:hypothetical protein